MRAVVPRALSLVFLAVAGCSLLTDLSGLNVDTAPGDGGAIPVADAQGITGDATTDRTIDDECQAMGLVAFWRMDDGTGTVVRDCSPNGLEGHVLVGAPKWVSGHRGGALQLDGSSCIEMGNAQQLNLTGALTVSLWVSIIEPNNSAYLVGKRISSGLGWRLALGETTPSFELNPEDIQVLGPMQPIGTWVHLAATFEPAKMTVYVGGAVFATRTAMAPPTITTTTAPFRIGCNGSTPPGSFAHVAVDDVRLYSRALSADEIRNLAK